MQRINAWIRDTASSTPGMAYCDTRAPPSPGLMTSTGCSRRRMACTRHRRAIGAWPKRWCPSSELVASLTPHAAHARAVRSAVPALVEIDGGLVHQSSVRRGRMSTADTMAGIDSRSAMTLPRPRLRSVEHARSNAGALPEPHRGRFSTGIDLEYVAQGSEDGEPLILLHGLTDSWRSFAAAAAASAAGRPRASRSRCVVTGVPTGRHNGYTMRAMADDVDRLHGRDAHRDGHDRRALHGCTRRDARCVPAIPQRVRRLMLLGAVAPGCRTRRSTSCEAGRRRAHRARRCRRSHASSRRVRWRDR